MSEIKIEFAVQMKGDQDAHKVRESLKGLGEIEIDVNLGRVIINSQEPWFVLKEKIEETECKAVLNGFGGQSAVCIINTTYSDANHCPIQGILRFTALNKDKTGLVVDGVVDGLSPGLHGIHIHEAGDTSAGCYSVGNHYNPRGSPHGSPNDDLHNRHAGDLGNIRADTLGRASFRFVDNILDVSEIIGRSVVITQNPDDFGKGPNQQSRIDGNTGDRIACGIIARSAGILQNFKKFCACDGVTLWDESNTTISGAERSQKF